MADVECARCGLTPFDLPDGVDPELIFERAEDGRYYDQGCLAVAGTAADLSWELEVVSSSDRREGTY
jgi:hypothetical protein